jgi:hypothetical protein
LLGPWAAECRAPLDSTARLAFVQDRRNPRQQKFTFSLHGNGCGHTPAIVLSASFLSSKWFQEKINAKFASIYGPVFGIGFVSLLRHKHRWPDRYE